MSVMIWDSTSQAFVEAQTPMVYDTENQAWRETTGLIWDEQNQAWVEKWNQIQTLNLYNKGVLNTEIVGDFNNTNYGALGYKNAGYHLATPTFQNNSDNFYVSQTNTAGTGTLFFTKSIDITKYKQIVLDADFIGHGTIDLSPAIQDNYSSIIRTGTSPIDISDISGSYYMGFNVMKSYQDSVSAVRVRSIDLIG